MLSPVGRYEPRRPSGARSSTIVGTPRVGPDQAAEAEHQVADDRGRDDRADRHRQREREAVLDGGSTRNAPATITSSDTDRFAQSRKPSNVPSTRSRAGHGLDPPLRCVLHAASLRRHDPDQVRRV